MSCGVAVGCSTEMGGLVGVVTLVGGSGVDAGVQDAAIVLQAVNIIVVNKVVLLCAIAASRFLIIH